MPKAKASASSSRKKKSGDDKGSSIYPWKHPEEELKLFLTYKSLNHFIHSEYRPSYHGRYGNSHSWGQDIQTIKLSECRHNIHETDKLDPDLQAALDEFVDPGLRFLPHQVTCMQWIGDRVGWKSSEHLLASYGKWAETFLPTSEASARLLPDCRNDGSYVISREGSKEGEMSYKISLSCVPHGYFGQKGQHPKLVFGTPTNHESVGKFLRDYTPGRVTSFAAGTLTKDCSECGAKTDSESDSEPCTDIDDSSFGFLVQDSTSVMPQGERKNGGLFNTECCVPVYLCSIPTGLGKTMIGLGYAALKAVLRRRQREQKTSGKFHCGNSPVFEEDFILPQAMLSVPGKDAMTEDTWTSLCKKEIVDYSGIFSSRPVFRPWTDCCFRSGVLVVAPAGGIQSTWEVTLKQWFPKLALAKLGGKDFPKNVAHLKSILESDVILTDKATFTSLLQSPSMMFNSCIIPADFKWIKLPKENIPSTFPNVTSIGVLASSNYHGPGDYTVFTVRLHPLFRKIVNLEQLKHILTANCEHSKLQLVESSIESDCVRIKVLTNGHKLDKKFEQVGIHDSIDEDTKIDPFRLNEQLFSGSVLHDVSWSGIVVDEAHKWSEEKLRLLKNLRADDIILLTASMTMPKFSAISPVSTTLLDLGARLRSSGGFKGRDDIREWVSYYHIFHLDKEQKYNDTQRSFFEAPVLSQKRNQGKRPSNSTPMPVAPCPKDSMDGSHNPQTCKIQCTWTVVPLESDESLQEFYKKVTQFLANMGSDEQNPDTNKKWDPRGHAGKLLRLLYTAIITGVVGKQSTKYVDDLLHTPAQQTVTYHGTDTAYTFGAFESTTATLKKAMDVNDTVVTESTSANGVISQKDLLVYPHWNSIASSPHSKLSPDNCTECRSIKQNTVTNIEAEKVVKVLQTCGLTFDRDTLQFERFEEPQDPNRRLRDSEIREINSSRPRKIGLYSGMCEEDDLVVPLSSNKDVSSIHQEISWVEAMRKHKWLENQKPNHLMCILCSDTSPAEINELVTPEDDAWIIQPLILPCGHYYCSGCLQLMLNFQTRQCCPSCRCPFRFDETRRLKGMPHSVDDWFDRLSTSRHATHKAHAEAVIASDKQCLKKQKKESVMNLAKPLCKASTVEVIDSINSAIQDLQELCSNGSEGEPTEHAPFSYPKVVQSIELRSRNSVVKLLASPQNRKRKKANQNKSRPSKAQKLDDKASHVSSAEEAESKANAVEARPTRAAASAARSKFRTFDSEPNGHSSSDSEAQFNDSEESQPDGVDCSAEDGESEDDGFSEDEESLSVNDSYVEGEAKFTFKARAAAKILREQLKPKEKALVFVSSAKSATYLKKAFDKLVPSTKIATLTSSDRCNARGDIINDFWEDGNHRKSVLIVQYSAGGMGINLQTANHVIVLEPCTGSAMQQQAIGRVWRLGQQRSIHVHVVASIGTIDHVALRRYARTNFNPDIPMLSEETFGLSLKHAIQRELPNHLRLSYQRSRAKATSGAAAAAAAIQE